MSNLARRLPPIDVPRPPARFDLLSAIARLGISSYARGLAAHAEVAAVAPLPAWLTIAQAARHSGLSVTLLRRLIALKRLPSVRDGSIKVRRVDLDNLDGLAVLTESSAKLAAATAELRRAVEAKGVVQ